MKLPKAPRAYSQTTRAQSAEATGKRIVEAFLARLMKQWYDEITLDRIAEDAGVTVQTVVRRFGGKEGLLASTVKVLGTQIDARRAAPGPDIHRHIDHLVEDYEQIGETVLRLLASEPRHPALSEFLDFGRRSHREWVTTAFADSLGGLKAQQRERAVNALVVVTDVYSWKILRRDRQLSPAETKSTMGRMLVAILTEFSNPKSK
jgi:AcrR family transcriptional regulator